MWLLRLCGSKSSVASTDTSLPSMFNQGVVLACQADSPVTLLSAPCLCVGCTCTAQRAWVVRLLCA